MTLGLKGLKNAGYCNCCAKTKVAYCAVCIFDDNYHPSHVFSSRLPLPMTLKSLQSFLHSSFKNKLYSDNILICELFLSFRLKIVMKK